MKLIRKYYTNLNFLKRLELSPSCDLAFSLCNKLTPLIKELDEFIELLVTTKNVPDEFVARLSN